MVNKTKSRKQQTSIKKAKTKKPSRTRRTMDRLPVELRSHLGMILDPCSAPLTSPVYSGPTGTVQRFVITGAMQSTTQQAAYLCVNPGGFRTVQAVLADAGTATTPGYGVADVPGYAYLQANANGARIIGACLEVHWNASETSRGGSISCGVVPGATIRGGVATTINNIYGTLPSKERIPSGTCEIVWNPGKADDSYDPCDSALQVPDFDDKNAMVFAYQGPPGFQLAYTYTVIYEWVPRQGLGQPAQSTVNKSVPDAIGTLNNVLYDMGFTNKGLRNLASSAISTTAKYTGATGMLRVMKTGISKINTLLP